MRPGWRPFILYTAFCCLLPALSNGFGWSATPARSDLLKYVYTVKVREPGARGGTGALHLGGGFFLSADGELVTVLHLFRGLQRGATAVVAVDDGDRVIECPIESITAYSRELDFARVRVRLGAARVNVPPLGDSVKVGEKLFGFVVQVQGPVGPRAGPLAKAGILSTEGWVLAVSPLRIDATGRGFLGPGASGCPAFDSSGRVIGVAQRVDAKPRARKSDWIYVSLPIRKATAQRKLAAPLSFSLFIAELNRTR